ncbi:MAG: dephospho-CoA kinase [Candidatus Limnocylindrales bacterium]
MSSDEPAPAAQRRTVTTHRAVKADRTVKTRRTVKIGITGPIGCGKSTILGWLAARGALVIDADHVAREVTAPGSPLVAEIVAGFGSAVAGPNGSLDRAALAAIVFNDPAELRRLESITHPVIRRRILEQIGSAETTGVPFVALEAIRLVEGGYPGLLDEVWLVTCDPPAQRSRLAARGLGLVDTQARIDAQADLLVRARAVATRVIDTSGTPAVTEAAVDRALQGARARAGRGDHGKA